MERLIPLIEAEKLSTQDAEKLVFLSPDAFCFHRSWGYGQVKNWDLVSEQLVVDFETKSGHFMKFEFAAQSLSSLASDHIYVLKKKELERVQTLAKEKPLELMAMIIESLGSSATSSEIEKMLVPDVISKDKWKKWWEGARRAMKKDGQFVVPLSKTSPLKVTEVPKSKTLTLDETLELKGILPQLEAAEAWLKRGKEAAKENGTQLEAFIRQIEASLKRAPASQKTQALKLALVRDELAKLVNVKSDSDVATIGLIHELERDLGTILVSFPPDRQKAVLCTIKEAEPYTWPAAILKLLSVASARLVGVIRDFFREENQAEVFLEGLKRAAREQSIASEVLVWVLKNRKGELGVLIEPRLFNTLIAAVERDQIGEKKSIKLRDLILSDKLLLTDLVKEADLDAVRDITRGLLLTAVFDEMDKRSLLARLIKLYPEMQELVNASSSKGRSSQTKKEMQKTSSESEALIVSWESLEKRKQELDELINKKIPANTQEIAVARSYGDLRENSEFKFAKEQQRVLSHRRAELEHDILRAKGTDFRGVDAKKVGIGTVVAVSGENGEEIYKILGAWDGDPERKIVSYLTPFAKALQGKSVGEQVALPDVEGKSRTVTIRRIEPFVKD
ncbi:MAG: GreA/GreB family elongation factor [Verrucomicrobiae bacterium]|nr:GreA/GreB family elongation factor [Verrucomicrobiae bacterium]